MITSKGQKSFSKTNIHSFCIKRAEVAGITMTHKRLGRNRQRQQKFLTAQNGRRRRHPFESSFSEEKWLADNNIDPNSPIAFRGATRAQTHSKGGDPGIQWTQMYSSLPPGYVSNPATTGQVNQPSGTHFTGEGPRELQQLLHYTQAVSK